MAAEHENLVNACLLALGSLPNCRAWKTQVGVYRAYSQPRRIITIGPEGCGDIEGILAPHGRYWTVECKAGRDKQRRSQSVFERIVIAMGGIYVVAYSVEDAVKGVCGVQNI